MTHLFCTFEPQLHVVEEVMNVGRQREQIPEVMHTIRRKKLVNNTPESEGLEDGHSVCGMLSLGGGQWGS